MKKVKIMLMAICVVAVTGGLVAFKTLQTLPYCTAAATFTNDAWTCTATQDGQPLTCNAFTEIIITDLPLDPPGTGVICTSETFEDACLIDGPCEQNPVITTNME